MRTRPWQLRWWLEPVAYDSLSRLSFAVWLLVNAISVAVALLSVWGLIYFDVVRPGGSHFVAFSSALSLLLTGPPSVAVACSFFLFGWERMILRRHR